MDEGPVAMNGSDAQSRSDSTTQTSRSQRGWLWMLLTGATVIAVVVTMRLAGVPRAAAQAPVVRAGTPGVPTRPINPQPAAQPAASLPAPKTGAPAAGPQAPAAVASRPAGPQTLPPPQAV